MLELYHHGSSVCAAKVRLVLAEKSLPWTGHYLDILRGDQFDPAYVKLNPKAVVPTLVHDGVPVVKSSVICEYLEDCFADRTLRPEAPLQRAQMRQWTKAVDEDLHPACADLTFACSHRYTVLRMGEAEVQRFLDSTPPVSVTPGWHERKQLIVRLGLAAPGLEQPFRLYHRYLRKMEAALEGQDYLAGDQVSLADTAILPYVMRLDMLQMSGLWADGALPRVEAWLARMQARPSFRPAIWDWMPAALTEDFRVNGTESWPGVRALLGLN